MYSYFWRLFSSVCLLIFLAACSDSDISDRSDLDDSSVGEELAEGDIVEDESIDDALNEEDLIEGTVAHGEQITLRQRLDGPSFGIKLQSSPVLWDVGDIVYENGVPNNKHASFVDAQAILGLVDDTTAIYAKPSGVAARAQFTRNRSQRHTRVSSHYYIEDDGWLGWPQAYWGFDTPAANPKMYASWWVRYALPLDGYRIVSYSTLTGAFDEGSSPYDLGESITITKPDTTTVNATLVYIDTVNSLCHFIIDAGTFLSTDALGSTAIGDSSGASSSFSNTVTATTESNKFLRIWDNDDGSNLRVSWTQTLLDSVNDTAGTDNTDFPMPRTLNTWVLLETFVDFSNGGNGGIIRTYANNELVNDITDIDTTSSHLDLNNSPTFAQIGYDSSIDRLNQIDISEIYFDSTPQRVVITDHEDYQMSSHIEVQGRIVSWLNDAITLVVSQGSFAELSGKYFHIIGADNKPIESTGRLIE